MNKRLSVSLIIISLIILFSGCGLNDDKTALIEWLHSISEDNTDVYIVDFYDQDDENLLAKTLSAEEIQTLTDILGEISVENVALDEHPSEIPPIRYLIMLNDKEKLYNDKTLHLVSFEGDFKIYYQEKDWIIKSAELGKYILSFYEKEWKKL